MQDIQLSPHFKLNEFTKSRTARENGIDNTPPPEAVENLRALCIHTLEPLREALGLPIIITSGYRCKVLNERITHHSATSQHMQGEAADFVVQGSKIKVQGSKINALTGSSKIKVQGENRRELLIKAFRTIILNDDIDFDQLIIYPSFIHVSYVREGRKNRNKLTKADGHGHYCNLTRAQALELM